MTAADIADLREERAALFEQMKAINDKAIEEKRDLKAEEQQEWDRLDAALEALGKRIKREERVSGLEPQMSREVALPKGDKETRTEPIVAGEEYRAAYTAFLRARGRVGELEEAQRAILQAGTEEQRVALKVGTGAQGGFTVPVEFQRELVESAREFGVMRRVARIVETGGNGDLQIPALDTRASAAWTAEEGAYTESESTFKQVVLKSYKAAAISKISDELLADSAFDLLGFLARDLGSAIGLLENTAYVTGASGSTTTPEGVVKKATVGKTFATNSAITADEIIDLYHSLLSPYRDRAIWMMRDSTVQAVRKLKETTNQYLWAPGLVAGQPDVILGRPLFIDPDVPAIGTVAESVVFGDMSGYWIRDIDGGAPEIKVLVELYSANGQVGFRAHRRSDGDLVDTAAVRIGKHPV